jgi:hypothetical protein
MRFIDKRSIDGQPEQFATGEVTDRFIAGAETRNESEALRAAIANVALIAFQSESAMDPDDARFLLDYLRLDQYQQEHLAVFPEQAERLARLIRQGGSSVMPEILKNQFNTHQDDRADQVSDEELTRIAMNVADNINTEVGARKFNKELDDTLLNILLNSSDEI